MVKVRTVISVAMPVFEITAQSFKWRCPPTICSLPLTPPKLSHQSQTPYPKIWHLVLTSDHSSVSLSCNESSIPAMTLCKIIYQNKTLSSSEQSKARCKPGEGKNGDGAGAEYHTEGLFLVQGHRTATAGGTTKVVKRSIRLRSVDAELEVGKCSEVASARYCCWSAV